MVRACGVKVFNLMSMPNKTRFLVKHQSYECNCRVNGDVCSSKKEWNHDKYRCECKELNGQDPCKDNSAWNPSTCDCEYDKACGVGKHKNCECKKRPFDKLTVGCYNRGYINC